MLGVLGGFTVSPRAGWAQGNEEELLDHGKAEPGTPQHNGIKPSTHQCMMSTDTAMSGMAQCEGVEKKAKFSLFQRCSTHSCWDPGLGGWLLFGTNQ